MWHIGTKGCLSNARCTGGSRHLGQARICHHTTGASIGFQGLVAVPLVGALCKDSGRCCCESSEGPGELTNCHTTFCILTVQYSTLSQSLRDDVHHLIRRLDRRGDVECAPDRILISCRESLIATLHGSPDEDSRIEQVVNSCHTIESACCHVPSICHCKAEEQNGCPHHPSSK